MLFEIYFKTVEDAEKASLYQKFNNVITEYKKDSNFFIITLSRTTETPEKVLGDFIKEIYPNGTAVLDNFVSPRMAERISTPISYPVKFTLWDTDKFNQITI